MKVVIVALVVSCFSVLSGQLEGVIERSWDC